LELLMVYETIRVDVVENIQTITLHRPEKLNAFTRQMMQELMDAFGAADADDGVRAVIVTGAGRAFCAGADLSGGAGTFGRSEATGRPQPRRLADGRVDYSDVALRDGGGRVTLRIFECRKPVIGAINGPAVGIGATMLLPMGCTDCRAGGALRLCFRPAGYCDGGRLELVFAPYRRAGAGAGMVFFRTGFRCR
jgi:enoyl-CoA hydratase/carnithine racemase